MSIIYALLLIVDGILAFRLGIPMLQLFAAKVSDDSSVDIIDEKNKLIGLNLLSVIAGIGILIVLFSIGIGMDSTDAVIVSLPIGLGIGNVFLLAELL